MAARREGLFYLTIGAIVLAAASLPYLLAAQAGGEGHIFAGFLLNPIDGNSYLAKMRQGWQGAWLFTLPYTAEPGEGTYLFLYYLFLGHVGRASGLPLLAVFHLARLAGALVMLLALHRFFRHTLPDRGPRRLAFALTALGSGLGWMLVPFGGFTSDFWVAEAYPFLSAYANPHFPLGLAILLVLLTPGNGAREAGRDALRGGMAAVLGLALGIVMPFGVLVAAAVVGGRLALVNLAQKRPASPGGQQPVVGVHRWPALRQSPDFYRLLGLLVGGGPAVLYDLWAVHTHPALAGWNAQNLTPSPPAWDLLISFSPVVWLALPGSLQAARMGGPQRDLLVWAGLGMLFLYLPFGLQRRMMLGLAIPLAGLAALGFGQLLAHHPQRKKLALSVLFVLVLPTNLLVLLAAGHGILSRDPQLYLSRGEALALEWLAENTPPSALVLAAPDSGLFIPAWTGRRVLYGHPFETVQAEARRSEVRSFFETKSLAGKPDLLAGVDYVFAGPRERDLGPFVPDGRMRVAYQKQGVVVYTVGEQAGFGSEPPE